jgi:uncharacterized membrane protein
MLAVALTVTYPLLLWTLRSRVEPKWLSLILVLVVGLRLSQARRAQLSALLPFALVALVLAAIAFVVNDEGPLRWYPMVVNLVLLGSFGATLVRPPSMAERFARLSEPVLPAFAVEYTRRVTIVWCVFFAFNAAASAWTAAVGTPEQWAFYNGLVAYVLVGAVAALEYLVRRRVKARHVSL